MKLGYPQSVFNQKPYSSRGEDGGGTLAMRAVRGGIGETLSSKSDISSKSNVKSDVSFWGTSDPKSDVEQD